MTERTLTGQRIDRYRNHLLLPIDGGVGGAAPVVKIVEILEEPCQST